MLKRVFYINWANFSILAVVLLLSAILAHYSFYNSRDSFRTYQIKFQLETEQQADFALYYDVGQGFNELDMQSVKLDVTGEPVTVQFCMPVWGKLERLRFDPAMHYVEMILYSITISSEGKTFNVPMDTLNPENQILQHEWDGTRYTFETVSDANDPFFMLDKFILTPELSALDKIMHYGAWLFSGLLFVFLGSWIYRFFFLGAS